MKEASRQIVAGGSAGKSAPPSGASCFSSLLANVSQTSFPTEVLPPPSTSRAAGAEPEPAEPERGGRARAAGALRSRRRGARVGRSRVPLLLGS